MACDKLLLKGHSELVSESHKSKKLSFADRLAQKFEILKLIQNDKFLARFVSKVHHENRSAFTLAEVLITLTIIGVIAAMTIPNLMQTWKKHERITQIKAARSVISNAIRMSVSENGSTDGWVYTNKTDFSEKYILPYLKIKDNCMPVENVSKCKCFNKGSIKLLDNTYLGSNVSYMLILENGMHLGIMTDKIANEEMARFIVDVNGKAGRTEFGSDVFVFRLEMNTGKVVTDGGTSNYTNAQDALTKATNGGCNKASLSAVWPGFACAKMIELSGWEFPEDYPVKKF